MRGADTFTDSLFILRRLEDFVPDNHPLRPIRQMVNQALVKMDALLSRMYAADIKGGRPSTAPSCWVPCCWKCSTASAQSVS